MRTIYKGVREFISALGQDNVTVYSAYAAFYMIISFVPFIMMLLMVSGLFVNITSDTFGNFPGLNMPQSVSAFIYHIVEDAFNVSNASLISFPALTLLWASSRSVVAIARGLDSVYKIKESRGVIKLNLYGVFYTFIFFVAILFSLIIMVFGNILADALSVLFPFAIEVIEAILSARAIVSIITLTLFFMCVYKFIPGKKLKFFEQFPGAVFSASGWMIFSLFFSIYVDNFSDKSYLYGSLTALILFMLWVYFCMVIMFVGGEINNIIKNENYDEKKGD